MLYFFSDMNPNRLKLFDCMYIAYIDYNIIHTWIVKYL
jgi:hypothetical protein